MSPTRLRKFGLAAVLFASLITAASTAQAQWPIRYAGYGYYNNLPVYGRSYYPRYYRTPVYIPPSYGPSGFGLRNGVAPRPVVLNPGFIGY
ncbi:MAG: hypothetical protein MI757_17390 [Pirellulales bacterium]|nr:hypothetical protein [Pirellulales bacterium]